MPACPHLTFPPTSCLSCGICTAPAAYWTAAGLTSPSLPSSYQPACPHLPCLPSSQLWELYCSCCVLDSRGLRSLSTSGSGSSGAGLPLWRPTFPDCAPRAFVRLAEACWDANPYSRYEV